MTTKDWTAQMNTHLEACDRVLLENGSCQAGYGSLYITGLPRCASTFFIQILGSLTNIGYINNRLGKFYDVPVAGAMINQGLGMDPSFISSFESEYGNTRGDHEPHEWGWFWQKELKLEKDDHYVAPEFFSPRLERVVNALSHIKGAPILFDNVFAMLNLDKLKIFMQQVLPVHLKRDPFYVANSILNARELRYGNITTYYGYPPRGIKTILKIENPVEQVVAQVRAMEDDLSLVLNAFGPKKIFSLAYEDLVSKPVEAVYRFKEFLAEQLDFNLMIFEEKISCLPMMQSRNHTGMIQSKFEKELNHYFNQYF